MRLDFSIILLLITAAMIKHGRAESVCFESLGSSTSIGNRESLIRHLAANVSFTGFTTATVGRPPDQVHGLGMCVGNASGMDCRRCVTEAITWDLTILTNCTSAFSWETQCMWRYSPENFVGVVDVENKIASYSINNVTEHARFQEQRRMFLNNLTVSTVSNKTGFMFSMGEIGFNASHKIEGLVQCTRDISKAGCGNCLATVRSFIADIDDDWISLEAATGSCMMRCRLQPIAPPPPAEPFNYPPSSFASRAFRSLNMQGTPVGKLIRNLAMIIISMWAYAELLF
ncbi:cysteine-rich repeat secretory protein 38-like [Nymphaea colorata]|nr:cysteine-rich repeat secretory protein 38-like [Nymphaea colorata]